MCALCEPNPKQIIAGQAQQAKITQRTNQKANQTHVYATRCKRGKVLVLLPNDWLIEQHMIALTGLSELHLNQ